MKTCKGCNITKPKTEFYHHNSNIDGLNGKCKMCIKAYSKKVYYKSMQDPFLKKQYLERIKQHYERNRQNTRTRI